MSSVKALYKILFISGLFVLANCSVEKNTGTTRLYHGMTARFNIYFNGYESFKSGLSRISNSYHDDYAEMLKVFEYSDPSTVSLCQSDMETAIQKASKLITLKSITAKPEVKDKRQPDDVDRELLERKEYNEWVDDSYLLIGKARFYKHEFAEAASVFNFSITGANDPLISKEAEIWLARVNNETGNFNISLRLLNELDVTTDFPKSLQAMYNTTLADLYVKQKRYSEAIAPLEKALNLISGKRTRYRLTYLLAQLYENTGSGARATTLYRKVVKMNPPYEVEFNARINIADVFDINSGDPEEIRKELERMLRDSKNKDFQDQIYFALGNMSMKEGNEAEALDFFRKSANSTSLNPNQKGRAYLALANHFYEKKDYMKAGTYYDSTVYFLDEKHPEYQNLRNKSQNLNALVAQLTVIQREDSLQRVAAMPEQQRNAFIAQVIATAAKNEAEGKTSEYSDRYNIGQYYENERRFQGNIEQEGKWYFYNQAALTFGRTEFRRRWGERKLEDNWRRSNRARVNTSLLADDSEENQSVAADTNAAVNDPAKPEFYLKNLPLNDTALAVSNDKLALALLDAGKAYSERISDTAMATETLEKLISRYPESQLLPEALYDLYNFNKDKNSIKAEAYRQRLLERFPSSEFGRILSDPAYHEKKMADLKISENLYEDAYNKYTTGNYNDAIMMSSDALEKYPQNVLAPKFLLLRAYSIAAVSDERKFKDELNTVIKTWPGTPESKKAEELISFLNKKLPELKVEEDRKIAAELYFADTTSIHMFTIIIEDPAFNINQATFDVISYNIDNYTNNNLKTEGTLVDNKYIMINVSGFRSYSAAMEYYGNFNTEEIIRNTPGKQIMSFIINDTNFKVLSTDKNPDRYRLFFIENYIKRK